MGFGLAIGLVIDFGGLIGQGETAPGMGDSSSDGGGGGAWESLADSVGGIVDERRMIQVPLRNIPRAIKVLRSTPLLLPSLAMAATAEKVGDKPFYRHIALYIGPVLSLGFFYGTAGICFGGFGCFAGGGGLKFGNFGIGVLFPILKMW